MIFLASAGRLTMIDALLLCTDLDRTLLPNGNYPESPEARLRFAKLVARPEVTLAYVTGRHKALVEDAINEYHLPLPDYVISDVGTNIYRLENNNWIVSDAWQTEIAPDWQGFVHEDLVQLFTDMDALSLQEDSKQNVFKLSYYAPQDINCDALLTEMDTRLKARNIRASVIWSIDDLKHVGLVDILPQCATKLHAVEFLMQSTHFSYTNTVFAGDSGNDIPVLISPINSVLVANARDDVRKQVTLLMDSNDRNNAIYFAKGDFLNMNGNYSAGILEGVAHFMPGALKWIK